jgi:large subunit ribosomal protein L9
VKVILTSDVPNIGQAGEVKKVADGYARNYLIPKGMAVRATRGAMKDFERRQATQAKKQERQAKRAERLTERLSATTLTFEAKAGSTGRLYGSVTKAEILEALERELGESFDKREVTLPEPIREVGEHFVSIRLMAGVEPQFRVLVKPEGGELSEAVEPEEEPAPEGEQVQAEEA